MVRFDSWRAVGLGELAGPEPRDKVHGKVGEQLGRP